MRLIASVIARNEMDRYLKPCMEHLLEFCDEVRVFDDASTDGTSEFLATLGERVKVLRNDGAERDTGSDFHRHAENRNRLFKFTLAGGPTYILAIDADEFVSDGNSLRRTCERENGQTLTLTMREVWHADEGGLGIREDNLWRSHEVMMLWPPSAFARKEFLIKDLGPATGRTPQITNTIRAKPTGESTLHFGWANESRRQERYERYVTHDGGNYHQKRHIDSIMWPNRQVKQLWRPWPNGLQTVREEILLRSNSSLTPS